MGGHELDRPGWTVDRDPLIENVPEFIDWGPLDEDGRPDKSKKGIHFQAWFLTFQSLGYRAEWRMLNAADHGDATTRVQVLPDGPEGRAADPVARTVPRKG